VVDKLLIVLVQLRHVPPAIRSTETAVKHEDDMLFTGIIRKPYCPAD
jgi:hypothetical protein